MNSKPNCRCISCSWDVFAVAQMVVFPKDCTRAENINEHIHGGLSFNPRTQFKVALRGFHRSALDFIRCA